MNVSVIEIDSSAVRHNLSFFRSKLKKNTKLLVVVKAFSYGSDSVIISKILANENVGYYSLAFKVYQAFRGLLKPVNQALFPFLSKKYIKNKTAYYKLVKQISMIYVSVLVVLSVLLSF